MVTMHKTARLVPEDGTEKWQYECCGLSTDTKPTNVGTNSLFLELDTGNVYYFNAGAWAKVGG